MRSKMGRIIKETIHANGGDIGIYTKDFENEYISLTDIARYKSDDPTAVIQNWMDTLEVLTLLLVVFAALTYIDNRCNRK